MSSSSTPASSSASSSSSSSSSAPTAASTNLFAGIMETMLSGFPEGFQGEVAAVLEADPKYKGMIEKLGVLNDLLSINPLNVNLYENSTHYIVEADVPGVSKADIKVTYKSDHTLSISYIRKDANLQAHPDDIKGDAVVPTVHRSELLYGKFARIVTLPSNADPNAKSIGSFLNDGVMRLTVPKVPVESSTIHFA